MASTYSTNLRLELIGTGDQAGVWGATTNNNLGTLLDEAIAGVQTVTCSSTSNVLTVNDAVVDQARAAVLVLTGTPGAAFSVFAPPSVSKTYTVYNNTTGVSDATFYLSATLGSTTPLSGGVSVVVPNGKIMQIWTDGTTGFYAADTTTIPVSRGGTALTSYTAGDLLYSGSTNTLNKLAITGTSYKVLVSDGSLPSWGAVNLAQSAAVTGILGYANGGTGLSSYTTGQTLYASATNTLSKLNIGANYTVLTSNGTIPGWGAVNLAQSAAVTGTLGISNGGTNITTYTTGQLLYASATNTLGKLNIGTSGNILRVANLTGVPEWGTVDLSSGNAVSNYLNVSNGGTGQSGALNQYGVIYGYATNSMSSTAAAGGTDYFLVGSAAAAPSFKSAATLGVYTTAGGLVSGTVSASSGFIATNGTSLRLNNTGDATYASLAYNGTNLVSSTPLYVAGQLTVASGGITLSSGSFVASSGGLTVSGTVSAAIVSATSSLRARNGTSLVLYNVGDTASTNINYNGTYVAINAPYGGNGSYPQLSNVQRYTAGNGTITANSGCEYLFIDCNLTSATIVFPSSPLDGQKFTVTMWQSFSATGVSWSAPGTNISAAPSSLSTTLAASWVYLAVTTAWFRVS